jgi:hypothetical protein
MILSRSNLPPMFVVLIFALFRTEEDPTAEGDEFVPDQSERSRALVAFLSSP